MLVQVVVRDELIVDVLAGDDGDDEGDEEEETTIGLAQVVSTLDVAVGAVVLGEFWRDTITVSDFAELVGALVPDVSPFEVPVEAGMDRGGGAVPAGLDPTGLRAGVELELERLSV